MHKQREQQVEAALEQMRPWIRSDGGGVSLVDISGGVVTVRLEGNCVGCGAQQMTVDEGIKAVLMSQLDWVTDVVATEDPEPAPRAPGIRAALEQDAADTESLLVELDESLLSMGEADPLPNAARRWNSHAERRLPMLFAREEECVFPVLRDFLNTASGPVGVMLRDHRELELRQRDFRLAADAYRPFDAAALKRLRESGRAVTRQLSAHLIRERTSVFELLDRALPDDLKQELLQDLQRYEAAHAAPMTPEGATP